MSDGTFASVLARLFGQSDEQIRHALGRNSILFTSGLIEVDHDECDFSNKVSIPIGFSSSLQRRNLNHGEIGTN